jgi:hypothetical protein
MSLLFLSLLFFIKGFCLISSIAIDRLNAVSHFYREKKMTVCKVLLYGLKPCDINSSTNEKISETSTAGDMDFLNLDIKPLTTPTSSVSMTKKKEMLEGIFSF